MVWVWKIAFEHNGPPTPNKIKVNNCVTIIQTSVINMKGFIKQTVVVSWTIYLLTPLPDRLHTNLLVTQI